MCKILIETLSTKTTYLVSATIKAFGGLHMLSGKEIAFQTNTNAYFFYFPCMDKRGKGTQCMEVFKNISFHGLVIGLTKVHDTLKLAML